MSHKGVDLVLEVHMGRATNRSEMRELMSQYGEPFARALAVFVSSLGNGAPLAGAGKGKSPPADLQSILEERLAESVRRNDAEEKAGTLVEFEFTGNSPQESVADRIKQLMKQQGMKQRDLAAKLKVSPAVISRILNQPSRSRLDTLSKIAQALAVPVRELV